MIQNSCSFDSRNFSLSGNKDTCSNKDYSGTILYLHYPNYRNHSRNTFSGVLGNIWDKTSLSGIEIQR